VIAFADGLPDVIDTPLAQLLRIERGDTGQQHVEQRTEGIDVRKGIDVLVVEIGLFRAHVLGRAERLARLGEECLLCQGPSDGIAGVLSPRRQGSTPCEYGRGTEAGRTDSVRIVKSTASLFVGILERMILAFMIAVAILLILGSGGPAQGLQEIRRYFMS